MQNASANATRFMSVPYWNPSKNRGVELAVAPLGAGRYHLAEAGSTGQAGAGSTGQHPANICGRMGPGDIQAGRLRRRSTKVQQEAKPWQHGFSCWQSPRSPTEIRTPSRRIFDKQNWFFSARLFLGIQF